MMKNKVFNSKMPKRVTAALMAGVLLSGTCPTTALAGAPQVQTDESVYVNMDYYGTISEIDVVKGCLLNGNTIIEDYGDYEEVTNMSNRIEPTLTDGKLTWDLSGIEDNKFYYECKATDLQKNLPWTFDVSYKLNGVEQRGEDLAGASGLVTIDINATANKDADEYYKNNMILMCGTAVDMDSTLSIEAPGSQLQTFGTMKGVIFMALPGEDNEFQINIGSDDFECYGVFFMMVPATLSSLDMIKDIKEAKDTSKDSLDAISDATDAVVDSITSMKDDMQSLKTGAQAAQAAKGSYDENRDSLDADVDAAIESIDGLSSYMEVLNNQMEVGEDDYNEVNNRLQAINDTIYGIQDYHDGMDDTMESIEDNLDAIRDIYNGTITPEGLQTLTTLFSADGANGDLSNLGMAALLTNYQKALAAVGDDPIVSTLIDSEDLVDTLGKVLDKLNSVLIQADALSDFATDEMRTNVLQFCDLTEELLNQTQVTLVTTESALKTIRYTLDAVEPSMDTAINSSLNGFVGLMESSMNLADSMGLVKDAKDTMKSAIDDELDEIEEESNILNIDTQAEFPSFTSNKNASPESIQIIMRTAEITKDDNTDNAIDLERDAEDIGVLGRLKAIFVHIWDGLTGLFTGK